MSITEFYPVLLKKISRYFKRSFRLLALKKFVNNNWALETNTFCNLLFLHTCKNTCCYLSHIQIHWFLKIYSDQSFAPSFHNTYFLVSGHAHICIFFYSWLAYPYTDDGFLVWIYHYLYNCFVEVSAAY